jgi:ABC-type polar amino acid transport system ATPase subunit
MTAQPAAPPRPLGGPDAAAVVCSGLTYRFGQHVAVDRVSLQIASGETFGLLGPNGAGKTTTIRMLTTLLEPAEGVATVFGVNTADKPMRVLRPPPEQLKAALGDGATLDDVFRHYTGDTLDDNDTGGIRDVRRARRTASRLG